ncbi:hypothetical protein [Saezia sanguinis]|uniref:hypothetical protein n=1 Tax=Saezia sanguinis TaxID=1965230 RepID=UPI00303D4E20
MKQIPTSATKEEIVFFIKGIDAPDNPVNTQLAAMAYLGMCRHEYLGPDWYLCQFAWEQGNRNIRRIAGEKAANVIRERIDQTYRKKGYSPAPTW